MASTKTCTTDGCDKPLRARGLCSTHYNQHHQPNRHRKVTMQCGWCGITVVKDSGAATKFNAVYCSLEHRDNARRGTGEYTELSADHWARWYGVASPWAAKTAKPARFIGTHCGDCDVAFLVERSDASSIYCSRRCARRVAKRIRRAREHNAPGSFTYGQLISQFIRQGKTCAYCKQTPDGMPDPEHVLPLSRGGRNDMSNIVAACRACNTDKSDMTLTEWRNSRQQRGLPNVDTTLDTPEYRHIMHLEANRPPYRLAA